MKLFWSTRSPFARKAWVAAHELGVTDRITLVPIEAITTREDPALSAVNPLGKIPVLVPEDEAPIFDSTVICEWLEGRFPQPAGPVLFPTDPEARIRAMRRNALADGGNLLILSLRAEDRREPAHRDVKLVTAWHRRLSSVIDLIENELRQATIPRDIGGISLAIFLGYHDFRISRDWRDTRPLTASWLDEFETRPAMESTRFVN